MCNSASFRTILKGCARRSPRSRFGSAGTLRASADWFDLQLDGVIILLRARLIVNNCSRGQTEQ